MNISLYDINVNRQKNAILFNCDLLFDFAVFNQFFLTLLILPTFFLLFRKNFRFIWTSKKIFFFLFSLMILFFFKLLNRSKKWETFLIEKSLDSFHSRKN